MKINIQNYYFLIYYHVIIYETGTRHVFAVSFFFLGKLYIRTLTLGLNANLVLNILNVSIWSLTFWYCVKIVFIIK